MPKAKDCVEQVYAHVQLMKSNGMMKENGPLQRIPLLEVEISTSFSREISSHPSHLVQ
jgi:hypothetical protein